MAYKTKFDTASLVGWKPLFKRWRVNGGGYTYLG